MGSPGQGGWGSQVMSDFDIPSPQTLVGKLRRKIASRFLTFLSGNPSKLKHFPVMCLIVFNYGLQSMLFCISFRCTALHGHILHKADPPTLPAPTRHRHSCYRSLTAPPAPHFTPRHHPGTAGLRCSSPLRFPPSAPAAPSWQPSVRPRCL